MTRELLQSVLDAIPDPVVVLDRDFRIVTGNRATHADHSQDDRQSRPICYQQLMHRDQPCDDCLAGEVFHTGEVRRAERADAAEGVFQEIHVVPIFDASGNVDMVLEQVHDVTDRKNAEEELRHEVAALESQMAAMEEFYVTAEAANRTKSELLANIGHEFRTPMTAILSYVDNLGMLRLSDKERRDALQTIRRNSEQLMKTINEVLDLSKIKAGKLEVECVDYSPVQLVGEIQSLTQGRAHNKGLVFEVEYATPMPETINTDPARVRQILINLIGNAIKFTDRGSVRVTTSFLPGDTDHAASICFEVRDTGIGMTAHQIDRLRQPFSEVDLSTARKCGENKLGLMICRRLTEELGGKIEAESEPGTGSTIRATIGTGPLEGVVMIENPGKVVRIMKHGAANKHTASRTEKFDYRILLAEDNLDNERPISAMLKVAGAEVVVAENGQIACEKALAASKAGKPFDLILMDMQMPVLDGYDATRRLRDQQYSGPIVALTAHARADDCRKCLDAGCDGYFSKPVKRDRLLALIAKFSCRV